MIDVHLNEISDGCGSTPYKRGCAAVDIVEEHHAALQGSGVHRATSCTSLVTGAGGGGVKCSHASGNRKAGGRKASMRCETRHPPLGTRSANDAWTWKWAGASRADARGAAGICGGESLGRVPPVCYIRVDTITPSQ